jgi:glycosyltransferase involved in cell wall biosynthesis
MNNKPKSVLHILSSLNIGGAERFVIDLAVEQRQSLALNTAILSFGHREEALVKECGSNNIHVYFAEGSTFKKILTLRKIIKSYDVVHFHSPYTLLFSCYYPFLTIGKKIIYTRHGAEPFTQPKWRLMHKLTKFIVNHITFVSDEGKAVFGKAHGWGTKSQTVLDNGILIPEESFEKPKEVNTNKIRLGSVARMVPLKNQVCLLKALLVMSHDISANFELHFFGNGPCDELLRIEAEKLRAQVNVVFHGMVINRDDIYSNMDVMVVTSEMEGLSIAILEAMARKIPVLATNVGGNPKLVQNNTTGQLFDYDNHEMLSKQLSDIVQSPETIRSLGQQAYSMVKNNYSLETVANKYMQLYVS